MISLYRPGSGILHRAPAGLKLGVLAVAALGLSLGPLDSRSIAVVLVAVAALYPIAGAAVGVLLAELWRLRWLILLLAATLVVFVSPAAAWIGTGRVVALLLLASLLTLTTRMSELLAVIRGLLRPFRRAGVDGDAVALTISLAVTMIPEVSGFVDRVRQAGAARGVRLGARSVVPVLVLALKHADDVGDALAARGLVGDLSPSPHRR